jgi:hypothetical protein
MTEDPQLYPGVWVRWNHQLPPMNVEFEARFEDGEPEERFGTRCQRGCCFFDRRFPDECLVTPKWWRIPEVKS